MKLSTAGLAFLIRQEGFVSRAYQDVGGVWTIGSGFTKQSQVFATYWLKTRGHSLQPGDTIEPAEYAKLLRQVVDHEYGRAVRIAFAALEQHQFDGATSACFNLGTGSLQWRWATALAAGDIPGAAQRLRNGYNTVAGVRIAGLLRRRKAEARLIEHGDYQESDQRGKPGSNSIRLAQRLLTRLKFNPGPIDGVIGTRTTAALRAFQASHPNLATDGLLGPATKAALARLDVPASELGRWAPMGAAIGAALGTAGGAALGTSPLTAGLAGSIPATILAVLPTIWRHRTELKLLWKHRPRLFKKHRNKSS
jgi:GH24 family phage-related lysozyme (muramidase)